MKQMIPPLFSPTLKKKQPPDFIQNLLSEEKGDGYWKRARMGTQISDHAYLPLSVIYSLQRQGQYAPPPGASHILGIEASGHVAELGPGCQGRWKVGDAAMALLPGGGQAQYVTVPEGFLMPIPAGLTLPQAAAIPETWLTAFQLLHLVGEELPSTPHPCSTHTPYRCAQFLPDVATSKPSGSPGQLCPVLATEPHPNPASRPTVPPVGSGPHTMLAVA